MTCTNTGTYNTSLNFGSGDPWSTGPYQLVSTHLDISRQYAASAFNNATCYLNEISRYIPNIDLPGASVTFAPTSTPDPVFDKPEDIDAPEIDISIPNFPEFSTGYISGFPDISAPSYDLTSPTPSFPSPPDELVAYAPDAPDIETEFIFPDSPEYILPDVPTLESLNIPDNPILSLPTFDRSVPEIPSDLIPPNLIFNFHEEGYSSELMDALKVDLLDRIQNGGTGLNASVEQNIWDRARNREDRLADKSKMSILVEQAARGIQRPSGSLFAALDTLAQETQNKMADLSREVAIKQAELEQENLKFAIQSALSLEQITITLYNNVQQRSFEVEKYIQSATIDLYKARVAHYSLQLEVFKTYVVEFETRLKSELVKLDEFKTQLEAQKLIGDINKQYIDLYNAQLQGIITAVSAYKTEVDAVSSRVQAEGLKLQNYKTQMDGYSIAVGAKRDEYGMYSESIKAEMAKVSVFSEQVKAFTSRVSAYSAEVDAESKRVDVSIEKEKMRLQSYLGNLDGLVKNVAAQSSAAQAKASLFNSQAAMYNAEVGGESARLNGEVSVYNAQIQQNKYEADIAMKNAEVNIANARNSVELTLEALKQGAVVSGDLAKASLAAVSVGAQVRGSSQDIHSYQEK